MVHTLGREWGGFDVTWGVETSRTWPCPVMPISTLPRPTNRGISEAGRNKLETEVDAQKSRRICGGIWKH